jgi:hypothetical protein
MFFLNIKTLKKGIFQLKFQNFERFVWVAGHQIGILRGYIEDPIEYCNTVSNDYSKRFQEKEELGVFDNLNKSSVILNIGSGIGLLDIVLHQYIGGGKIILVDENKTTYNHTVGHWSETHGFYNSWDVFFDLINTSNISANNFVLSSPNDHWPEKLDLIMSSYSYLWHYPKNVYWNRIKPYALNKTNLCFDVLNRKENIKLEIDDELNLTSLYKAKPKLYFHWFINEMLLEDESPGKICFWRQN